MELFAATLDGYELRILDISDTISVSLVKHEFINSDGAVVINHGNRPREVKFRCFFFGLNTTSSTSADYSNHYAFLNKITDSQTTEHILVHPKYGRIIGYISDVTILHDDTQDYTAIDVSFVQKDIQNAKFLNDKASVDKATELHYIALNNAELAKAAQQMNERGAGDLIGKILDPNQTLIQQLTNLSSKARDFAKEIDKFVITMDNFAASVEAPINTIDAALNYTQDVPSRILGSINNMCNRVISTLSTVSNLPVQLMNNFTYEMEGLYNTISGKNADFFQVHFRTVTSGFLTEQAASMLVQDDAQAHLLKGQEGNATFDLAGNRISMISQQPVMTVNEIETVAYVARAALQTALELDRSNIDLEYMAEDLISYVDTIKINRLSIKTISVNLIPLHLLCNQLGLSYNAAERIRKLNPQIKNPTFTEGSIKVYVS